MKTTRLSLIIFSFSLVFCFSGVVMGAGIEPPGGGIPPEGYVSDCECVQNDILAGELEIPQLKGPYLKGTFTISYLPGSIGGGGEEDAWVTHMFLRWGNRIFLQPFITGTGGAPSLCGVTDEVLYSLLMSSQMLCYRQVEDYFDLEGTPFVKELIVTDRGGCETEIIKDDIVRGEITVSVPTTYTCENDGAP